MYSSRTRLGTGNDQYAERRKSCCKVRTWVAGGEKRSRYSRILERV